MRRVNYRLMINQILKQAPHRKFQTLSKLMIEAPKTQKKHYLSADKYYLDQFIYENFCQYILEPQFRHFKTNTYNNQNQQVKTNQKQTKDQNIKKRQVAEVKLLSTIKMLNQHKNSFIAYVEAKQMILALSSQEARKYKKYLIHIYKLLFNEKKVLNLDKQNLVNELKASVVSKIYEGHEMGEQQTKVKTELQKIEKVLKDEQKMQQKKENQYIEKIKKVYQAQSQTLKQVNKDKQ